MFNCFLFRSYKYNPDKIFFLNVLGPKIDYKYIYIYI